MIMLPELKRPELSCSDVPRRPRHGLNRHAHRNLRPRHGLNRHAHRNLRPRHDLNRTACRALRRHRLELSQGLLPLRATRAPGQGGEATNIRLLSYTLSCKWPLCGIIRPPRPRSGMNKNQRNASLVGCIPPSLHRVGQHPQPNPTLWTFPPSS